MIASFPSELWSEVFNYLHKRGVDSLSSTNKLLYILCKEYKKTNSWSLINLQGRYFGDIALTQTEIYYLCDIHHRVSNSTEENNILFPDVTTLELVMIVYSLGYASFTHNRVRIECSYRDDIFDCLHRIGFEEYHSLIDIVECEEEYKIRIGEITLCAGVSYSGRSYCDIQLSKDEITPIWFKGYRYDHKEPQVEMYFEDYIRGDYPPCKCGKCLSCVLKLIMKEIKGKTLIFTPDSRVVCIEQALSALSGKGDVSYTTYIMDCHRYLREYDNFKISHH